MHKIKNKLRTFHPENTEKIKNSLNPYFTGSYKKKKSVQPQWILHCFKKKKTPIKEIASIFYNLYLYLVGKIIKKPL